MKNYTDFVVRIEPGNGGYLARVLRSPSDYPEAELALPFDRAGGESVVRELGQKLNEWIGTREHALKKRIADDQEELGRTLYSSLFHGRVAGTFARTVSGIETARDRDKSVGLRIQLVFEPDQADVAHLAALPWELLYRAETHDALARHNGFSLVRHLANARPQPELTVDGKLRVLLVDSNPDDLRDVGGAEERLRIKQALASHADIVVEEVDKPELGELRDRVLFDGVHVLHFIGHGGFDTDTGEGAVAFPATADGDRKHKYVSGKLLAEHLKGSPTLRLVLLSSCSGAKMPFPEDASAYLNVAPALVRAGIPAVVAMQFVISDDAAIAFSTEFYRKLARCSLVDFAVSEGRLAMFRNDESPEWATPALFMRVQNSSLFRRPSAPAAAAGTGAERRPAPVRLLIRTGIAGQGRDHSAGPAETFDRVLRLDEYFDGRRIRDTKSWDAVVVPRLEEFLLHAAAEARPLHIDFAANASIAFAAGYFLEAKSGLDVRIRQRRMGGDDDWSSQAGSPPPGRLWQFDDLTVRGPDAADVALAVSVTRPVRGDVEQYVERERLAIRRVMAATVAPEPGQNSVADGAHAMRLAQQLSNRLAYRTAAERRGTVHLFAAAPNAFLFLLGQLARSLGRVQLYEYDFDRPALGAYRPSLRLPPAGAGELER